MGDLPATPWIVTESKPGFFGKLAKKPAPPDDSLLSPVKG